jgi:hypothetical protein
LHKKRTYEKLKLHKKRASEGSKMHKKRIVNHSSVPVNKTAYSKGTPRVSFLVIVRRRRSFKMVVPSAQ